MEHDAEMAPPIASHAPAADDWLARDDFEESSAESHSHPPAAAASDDEAREEPPPAPPTHDVNGIQSSLQSLELQPGDATHSRVQMEIEEERNRKRHLNVVFIGHVGSQESVTAMGSNRERVSSSPVTARTPKRRPRQPPPPPPVFTHITIRIVKEKDVDDYAPEAAVPLLLPQTSEYVDDDVEDDEDAEQTDDQQAAVYCLWGIIIFGISIIIFIFFYGFTTFLCPPDLCE